MEKEWKLVVKPAIDMASITCWGRAVNWVVGQRLLLEKETGGVGNGQGG